MALIDCSECNAQVSDRATRCVACGFQLQKPRRGFFGVIFKWLFILFNILMALWFVSAIGITGDTLKEMHSEAEQAGAAIGTAIGFSMILGLWVVGDVILGILVLFTRPKA